MLRRTHLTSELPKAIDESVVVAGWVHDIRRLGGITFAVLRDAGGYVQVTARRKDLLGEINEIIESLHQEDVVAVQGKVVKSKMENLGVEILPDKIELQSRSAVPLPLDPREVTPANLNTQLDWRFLYLRTKRGRAIFRIQSTILHALRTFLEDRGYMEFQPAVLLGAASEGGAELFKLDYFGRPAYLAQSPQLHKQMCALAFEKVYCVVPIFRAEKFEQPTHLNEVRQVDIEQAFATADDVIKVLEECISYVLKTVREKNADDLLVLDRQLPNPILPLPRITYTEAVEALGKVGEQISWGDDFSKTQESVLAKKFGELFFITKWPAKARAFFAMPDETNPAVCNAFDLIFDGLEIASGTQRVHIPELLEQQISARGLNPSEFEFYIDAFRYGAPMHSGWSVGLERLTMKVSKLQNIRESTFFPRDRTRLTP